MTLSPIFNSISSISLSGINNGKNKLDAAANNIANVSTEGYKKTEVISQPLNGGGVETGFYTDDSPGFLMDDGNGGQVELSNVNLTEEIVKSIIAQRQVEANVVAFNIGQETTGTLIDMFV